MLTALSRYHSRHLRSLFISKFLYSGARHVLALKSLDVRFFGAASRAPILGLFSRVVSGYWPQLRGFFMYTAGRKELGGLAEARRTLPLFEAFRLLTRWEFAYLPTFRRAGASLEFIFLATNRAAGSYYLTWSDLVGVLPECEALAGGLNRISALAHGVSWRLGFSSAHPVGVLEAYTIGRALGLSISLRG